MAEMTAAEAIAVLHNNQYQKHIGNGEYDYIHPLTDAQSKGIESLIQQQAAEIERLKCCGNCRYWNFVQGICRSPETAKVYVKQTDRCFGWEGQ